MSEDTREYFCDINSLPALFHGYLTGETQIPDLTDDETRKLAKLLKLDAMAKALKSSFSVLGCTAKFSEK